MKWAEISIQTSHEATEAVAEIFHELGASGVLIEDPELVNTYIHSGAWDYTDIPLAEETEVVTVKAWLPTDEDLPSKLEQLRLHIDEMSQFLDKGSGVINCSEIQDEDWANNWKQFFHPERIGEKIVVKPSWEEYTPLDNDIVIELDPGMAFGTGKHETTQLCIAGIRKYVKPGDNVLDVGTGSGILSICALLSGASHVVGTDLDENAIDAAHENAQVNGITSEQYKVLIGNLIDDQAIKDEVGYEAYDVVVANILADVIIALQEVVAVHVKHGGIFITSGIIDMKEQAVMDAFAKNPEFEVIDVLHQGEWVSIVTRRK